MNDRIKQFMDYKGISSSELADSIGVQRSNVTHVLQGRNKPGFLFISKILETYPEINAKWLITGEGNMLDKNQSVSAPPKTDLFTNPQQPIVEPIKAKELVELAVEPPKEPEVINRVHHESQFEAGLIPPADKEIERIVVFYTDQTFKHYLPSK